MGKSLIIPGADFSANAIQKTEWYLDDSVFYNPYITASYDYLVSYNAYSLHRFVPLLLNKTINILKVRKNPDATNAKIKLYHIIYNDNMQTDDNVTVLDTREINITNEGVSTYRFEPISISANETIIISSSSDNIPQGRGAMKYTSSYDDSQPLDILSFYMTLDHNKFGTASHSYFEINFGYDY